MDTFTIAVIVILILALLFFGFTILRQDSGSSGKATGYSAPSYVGGGCGR